MSVSAQASNQAASGQVRFFPGNEFNPMIKNDCVLYLWGICISIGAFVMGYFFVIVTVLSSSMTDHMNKSNEHGTEQKMGLLLSICTAAMPLGGLLGSLLYPRVIQLIKSENKLMVYTDILMIVLLALQMINLNIYYYSFLRLLQGFITGLYGIVVPQYLMSISPTKVSGLMGSFNQIMITVGIASAYAMGYVINPDDLGSAFNWRLCVFLPIPLCILRILVCRFFPYDSIERHISKREWAVLFDYLDKFYIFGTMTLQNLVQSKNFDLNSIEGGVPQNRQSIGQSKMKKKQEQKKTQTSSRSSVDQLMSKEESKQNHSHGLRLRQILAVVISIMSQFSGINAILFYSNQLFLDISHGDADYAVRMSLYLGLFQILVTLLSGAFLDRFGRRTLMICGASMIIFALLSGYYMVDYDAASKWDPQYVTYAIFLHMAGFSLSLGPITVVYISQITTDISPFMTFIWIETITISLVSNIMIQKFGTGKVFLFFALVSLAGLGYICKFMLETKGRTRQQVVRHFDEMDGTKIDKCLDNIGGIIEEKESKNYHKVSDQEA